MTRIFRIFLVLRLLEACLAAAGMKLDGKIYKKLFSGRLRELSFMKGENFSVQRLMDHCPTKEEFEAIFDELSEHFCEILERQHTATLLELGEWLFEAAGEAGTVC